ncbi:MULTISPECIES: type II toxin-antitoxin system death-on-curing family toxin [Mycolicibacterium]|uniref:Death-on-curing family protein n=2 Tax=Mycolicibacterium TaxID=1866885 RepID=G8RI97_MYCRN|nr:MULTISPECIES: type II toxin-antitoxin system death-on-curing family toxin [Mycolicibacterium]AEV73434.1 death-on-curing family protein [Mycolicibacterium rhodesiae NBB3]ORB61686.1 death-on-curing protein [Mycolicibacterium tusciae]
MTTFLTTDEIQDVNAHFVGPDKLRDFGLLEAAAIRPQSSAFGEDAYPTVHEKAAALLHALARNHPFVDGNKRTAWASTAIFYMFNGYTISTDQGDIVALVVDVAEGQKGVQDIAATLKSWTQPFDIADDWMG